jgi:hypothetical protein
VGRRREMRVGGLCPGCHELHAGELHTRPQRAGGEFLCFNLFYSIF